MIAPSADAGSPIYPEDQLFTLRNADGMRVTISERGAALVSWWTPDRYGRYADVVLGYADPADYRDNQVYLGAVVGRWANRIARGRFLLDGEPVQTVVNDRGNHLHGGPQGFHALRWRGEACEDEVLLRLVSPAGAAGFPGKVEVQVRYRLGDDGTLSIDYEAVTDAPTPMNLTAHPYFNLNGGGADVGDHMLQIEADHYLETDATGIPLGVASVSGTPFDFRRPAAIGARLCWPDEQLRQANGFDHCYCIRGRAAGRGGALSAVARVVDPGSGRCLQVSTTEAGLQFYSGNYLGGVRGRSVRPYARHDGFCLEAGAFPDQLNSEHAAAVILRPGQVYRQTTIYRITLA
ncbi:aldose epimerase family protein [Rugamonas rivuli]|uniref:Aldose 1-epimerase n=1 Tax=Rugamonas rivuli TaxID=2743358 RepID=A0A843S7Q0_9BURK|nr:aldose epimerase family protein [Rugamonas rivuli]MQA18498.1 galactose-1-epimerase [Rugamonas rivuli]